MWRQSKAIVLFYILFFIFCLILPASAITITEVELNPPGADSGREYIELYSSDNIDAIGWKLINNDGGEYELNRSFSGYDIVVFPKQWLDNKDERIVLIDARGKKVAETEIFKDSANDAFTWQLCGRSWEFLQETRGKKNICPPQQEHQDSSNLDNLQNINQEEELSTSPEKETSNSNPPPKPIIMLSKDIKTTDSFLNAEKTKYLAIFGAIIFCSLLIILLILRRSERRMFEDG